MMVAIWWWAFILAGSRMHSLPCRESLTRTALRMFAPPCRHRPRLSPYRHRHRMQQDSTRVFIRARHRLFSDSAYVALDHEYHVGHVHSGHRAVGRAARKGAP